MKKRKLFVVALVTTLTLSLAGCSSDSIKLEQENYVVELGDSISTKAETYLAKDTKKNISKDASVSFDENKLYTADKKKGVLKSSSGEYLPVGKYNGFVKYQDNKQDFIVEIKDTTAPKFIDFKDEISIEVGSDVKLEEYFKAEDLSQITISINKEKLDLTKEGSYEIQVTASDQYKNKETKKATVKVIAKEVVEEPAEENANNTTNNAGGTTPKNNAQAPSNGSNSNTGGNNTQAPSQPQQPSTPNVCTPNGTYQGLGNSGMWFNSMQEADAWAWEQLNYGDGPWGKLGYNGYHAWTVEDSCGNSRDDIWSVHFY